MLRHISILNVNHISLATFYLVASSFLLGGCATTNLWKLNDNLHQCKIYANDNGMLVKSKFFNGDILHVEYDYSDKSINPETCASKENLQYPQYLKGRVVLHHLYDVNNNQIIRTVFNDYKTKTESVDISIFSEIDPSSGKTFHWSEANIKLLLSLPLDFIQFVEDYQSPVPLYVPENNLLFSKDNMTLLSYLIDNSWNKRFGDHLDANEDTIPYAWVNNDGMIVQKKWNIWKTDEDYGIVLKLKEPKNNIKFIIVNPNIVSYHLYNNEIEIINKNNVVVKLRGAGSLNEGHYSEGRPDLQRRACDVDFSGKYGPKYVNSGTTRVIATPFTLAFDAVTGPFVLVFIGLGKLGFFGIPP